MTFASICAHDFFSPQDYDAHGAHILPIHQTSTFIYPSARDAMAVFRGEKSSFIYSRWSNPTIAAVEHKLALLEGYGLGDGQDAMPLKALLFSSGMAAISAMLQAVVPPGGHIVTSGNIYGTTVELMQHPLRAQGITTTMTDLHRLEEVEKILKENTTHLIYVETPTNPTIDIYDLAALAALAHKYHAKLAVDNTFSSPYLQQPFKWGADFVVHSTTKYLNGHGTALGGVWLGKDIPFMTTKGWQMRKLFGGNSNAQEAWLLNNGLKTLPLRMEQHCRNARSLALWLQQHPAVAQVHYAGLPSHQGHALAGRQMRDFGGMISFVLKGGLEAGKKMMDKIKFCSLTSSLGTPDTLITHPASMTHVKVPAAQREQFGITDGLIRMSVGLESVEDIQEDLAQAME